MYLFCFKRVWALIRKESIETDSQGVVVDSSTTQILEFIKEYQREEGKGISIKLCTIINLGGEKARNE